MSVIGSNILAGASGQGGEYTLTRSLRFRSSASAYLNRTPASAGNRKTWTYSTWVKRGTSGTQILISNYDSSVTTGLNINFSGDSFNIGDSSGMRRLTSAVYRDFSSWYHFMVAVDTTQASGSDRIKVYVNGVQVTSFQTSTDPSLNADTLFNTTALMAIGRQGSFAGQYFDGYQTEVNFIDGQALTPSSFGETNSKTGVWQPKKYAGTYGTNGFYLPFTDNSALTTSSNVGLGKDFSGNGNYWTTNNISITSGATYDSMTDVPTLTSATASNFATLNPLSKGSGVVLTAGNLNYGDPTDSSNCGAFSTIGMTSGKWYCEATITGTDVMVGLSSNQVGSIGYVGSTAFGWGYYSIGGNKYNNGSGSSYGASYTTNDVIGIAFDADNGTLTFYKNNTSQGTAYTGLTSGPYYFATGNGAGGTDGSLVFNFGQRPFAYTPPTGFVALNTFNLPTPTIGATASSQANKYFDATLYTGNGGTQSIVNAGGFQPDFVWEKARSDAFSHMLYNSLSGTGKYLRTNLTSAEVTDSTTLTSFNSNGFTVGAGDNGNNSGTTAVAWQWRGGGTGVTNTAGSITSTVSANTTSGFSIVTYTGNGSAGATVGHGLGVAPRMLIIKARDGAGYSWKVYHGSLGSGSHLELESTGAAQAGIWNSTNPSSTVFTLGTNAGVNENGKNYVCYAFSEVAGFSKFGSYTGNGSTDGPLIVTGFRPRFVMVKRTDSSTSGDWHMFDTSRDRYNQGESIIYANSSAAEGYYGSIDLLSNGFKIRQSGGGMNGSGSTYVYACFAEVPFKYALAR